MYECGASFKNNSWFAVIVAESNHCDWMRCFRIEPKLSNILKNIHHRYSTASWYWYKYAISMYIFVSMNNLPYIGQFFQDCCQQCLCSTRWSCHQSKQGDQGDPTRVVGHFEEHTPQNTLELTLNVKRVNP